MVYTQQNAPGPDTYLDESGQCRGSSESENIPWAMGLCKVTEVNRRDSETGWGTELGGDIR